MTEVNAEEFRARNAERLLSRGLQTVGGMPHATPRIRARFSREASEWGDALRAHKLNDRSLARSWVGVSPAVAGYLDLLLERSDDEWRAWHRFARRVADDVGSLLADRSSATEIVLPAADRTTIAILSVAANYTLDLPNTPAAWRSLAGINTEQPSRKREMDALVAEAVAYMADSANGRVPGIRAERGAIFAHGSVGPLSRGLRRGSKYAYSKTEELLDSFKELSLIELNEFVKVFEETFDVSAASPVAVYGKGRWTESAHDESEEEDSFDVMIESAGDQKIQVIKVVRELTSLGLGEAKAVVDGAPKAVLEGATKEAAAKAKLALERAGATVSFR